MIFSVFGQEPPVVAKPAGAPARPAMPAQPPIRSATAQATPYPQTQYNSAQQFQPPYPSQNQQFAPYPQQSHQNVHGPPTTGGYMPQQSPYPQGSKSLIYFLLEFMAAKITVLAPWYKNDLTKL